MTRRQFLALVAGVAAATGLRESHVAAALAAEKPKGKRARELTTLAETLRPGAARDLGYRPVVTGGGEAHVVRTDLAGAADGRAKRQLSLLSFVHLTDQHIVDVESPGRVEFLDRYTDGSCSTIPFDAAQRPHEAASARVADAMVRRIRAIGVSPVTGAAITAAICTGDNTDDVQTNELDTFLALMNGGPVTPASGDRSRYEGVQVSGDVSYWHPDPAVRDIYKTAFGFPDAPGFIERAQRPFTAAGLGTPWYSCFGNHDGLAQGNAPINPAFTAIVTGAVKVIGLPPGGDPCNGFANLGHVPAAPVTAVTADAARAYLTRRQWVGRHLSSPGLPAGHGFTADNVDRGTAYYAADVSPVRWIVLDTVNPGGMSDGSVGDTQLRWLDTQLAAADTQQRLVMLFSHHGPRSLTNNAGEPDPLDTTGGDLPRHLADDVLAVIAKHRCVIAWVNGHTHENIVMPRGAFWDIGTAAHIDWPAQARLIEVVDNRDGTLSIFGTIIDHDGDDVTTLARELCGNDPQFGFAKGTGEADDRNVELLVAHPFTGARSHAGPMLTAGLPSNLTIGGALAVAAAVGIGAIRERERSGQ